MSTPINITEREAEYLRGVANSEYGDYLGDEVWTFSVQSNSSITAREAPGVASSLVKKGLIRVASSGEDARTRLTEDGIKVVVARGLCEVVERVAHAKAQLGL